MSILAIPPAVVIIAILSIIYGALFHLIKGKGLRDLLMFILFAFLGFLFGQLVGSLLQLSVFKLGQVHVVEGTIFAWLAMLAFVWLRG
jgi:hypothetical protein